MNAIFAEVMLRLGGYFFFKAYKFLELMKVLFNVCP